MIISSYVSVCLLNTHTQSYLELRQERLLIYESEHVTITCNEFSNNQLKLLNVCTHQKQGTLYKEFLKKTICDLLIGYNEKNSILKFRVKGIFPLS